MKFETVQEALNNVKGATFIGVDTITEVKLKGGKKNPMQGRVQKVMKGANTMCFTNENSNGYENMVNLRLEAEGKSAEDFELKPRAWGKRIEGTPFVEHNDKYYLEMIFLHSGETEYLLDGNPIAKEDIEGLEETKVYDHSQGGLENKVVIRTFAVDNVVALRANGKEWK